MPCIDRVPRKACMGCGACEIACPVSCISLKSDGEGFLAPHVDGIRCIDCSRCMKVCPASNESQLSNCRRSVVFRSLDPKTTDSSSGGAAYSLGSLIIERGGAVIACSFDESGLARHEAITKVSDLKRTQGSKYVQSDAREGYRLLGQLLTAGREVLFVGTPCQIAAVGNLFGSKNKLITCDLICHGVPSPGFWLRSLDAHNASGNLKDRSNIMFRSSDKRSSINFELYSKSEPSVRIPYEYDVYYTLFIKNASLRESCYLCPFAQERRIGDLSIGDCASRDIYRDFYPYTSVSSVVANTVKGERILADLLSRDSSEYEEMNYKLEVLLNKNLHEPSFRPVVRDTVYSDLLSTDYLQFSRKYIQPVTVGWRIKRLVKMLVPVKARESIKRATRRLRTYDQ